jgi:glycosyltransferase involved in cell wall biosynthesis
VLYLPPRAFNLYRARRLLRETVPDTVYVNNLFSVSFAVNFLLAARLVHPRPKIVLAPRGQLDPPALNLKRLKKQIFLHVCRPLRIFRDVHWQASSDVEADEIRRNFGSGVAITVARNLRVPSEVPRPTVEKVPGQLRAVFLSRISPKKNLHFALTLLEHLRGTVSFTIAGPVDDSAYWERCQQVIHNAPPNVTIDYRGPVPNEEVAALLANHDLLLLPTLSENFGHVIVEALQVGTPVLISDQTPWRGLEQRHAGWDLPLDDPVPFVAALQWCIDLGPDEFRRLSSGARDAVPTLADDNAAVNANRALFGLAPNDKRSSV